MAVLGTVPVSTENASATPGAISIGTVPAGAKLCLILMRWAGNSSGDAADYSLTSLSASFGTAGILATTGTVHGNCAVGYVVVSSSGSSGTITPTWANSPNAGPTQRFVLIYLDEVDVSSMGAWLRDVDAARAQFATASVTIDTEPTDYVFGGLGDWDATPSTPSGTSSLALLNDGTGFNPFRVVQFDAPASGTETVLNFGSFPSVCAVSVKYTPENVGLQGGLTSVSTVQGSLGLAMPLEGTVSSVSRLSGGLGIPTVLQGTIASASDAASTLGLVQGLTGTIASVSQVQGQFALATALTGAIASTSNLTGDLTVAGDMSLVGTASSVSTVQGQLGLATGLTGIAKSTSQAVGGLGLNLLLSSEVRSVSEVHGGIGLSIPLSGTISSESALSGELSVAGSNALEGAISSVSELRGELNLSIGLAGSSRSESSLSSELTISRALALNGTISSVSRLSGVLSIGPYIDLQESITLGAYDSVRIYSNGTRLFTV